IVNCIPTNTIKLCSSTMTVEARLYFTNNFSFDFFRIGFTNPFERLYRSCFFFICHILYNLVYSYIRTRQPLSSSRSTSPPRELRSVGGCNGGWEDAMTAGTGGTVDCFVPRRRLGGLAMTKPLSSSRGTKRSFGNDW